MYLTIFLFMLIVIQMFHSDLTDKISDKQYNMLVLKQWFKLWQNFIKLYKDNKFMHPTMNSLFSPQKQLKVIEIQHTVLYIRTFWVLLKISSGYQKC